MLTFIHGFLEEQFPALVRSGLYGSDCGLKLTQCGRHTVDAPRHFNRTAAVGGMLEQAVKESGNYFYIDRLMGGTVYYRYPWDRDLLRHYSDMLGDHFLGFQLHEWASNLRQDWKRLQSVMGCPAPWTAPDMVAALHKAFPQLGKTVYLEAGSPHDFDGKIPPADAAAFGQAAQDLLIREMAEAGGRIVAADSYFMTVRQEVAAGVRHLMPEVGSQIPLTRVQTALYRGMARAFGRTFGTYYEPWGGEPFACCNYNTDGVNEWRADPTEASEPSDSVFSVLGETGGSSRALQKRIYFHSLFAGAGYISDEHGTCNTFRDHRDFELSAYGMVKKEFLSFLRSHPEAGDIVTPIALLLPRSMPVPDIAYLSARNDEPAWLDGYVIDGSTLEEARAVRRNLRAIFTAEAPRFGNEGHALTNSAYPDAFDILWEDAPADVLSRYTCVLPLTGNTEELLAAVDAVLVRELPLRAEGACEAMFDRIEGGYLLALLHNEGVERTQAFGDRFLPEAASSVVLHPLRGLTVEPVLGGGDLAAEDGVWRLTLAPGSITVLRILTQ